MPCLRTASQKQGITETWCWQRLLTKNSLDTGDIDMNTTTETLQEMLNKAQIECMQAIRERISDDLRKHGITLGAMDLIHKTDCKPLLVPDCETYVIEGTAWRKDKTKATRFSTEFVGKIGMSTALVDILDLVEHVGGDVMKALDRDLV